MKEELAKNHQRRAELLQELKTLEESENEYYRGKEIQCYACASYFQKENIVRFGYGSYDLDSDYHHEAYKWCCPLCGNWENSKYNKSLEYGYYLYTAEDVL